MAGLEQAHQHVASERGLSEERDAQRHCAQGYFGARAAVADLPRTIAGIPNARLWSGTSRVTSERVPTMQWLPIRTPLRTVTSEATQA